MIKRHTEFRTLEVSVIDARICNGCGTEAKLDKYGHIYNDAAYGTGIHVEYSGGIRSHLGEDTEFDFDLCDECVKKLIVSFKVPAVKHLARWMAGEFVDPETGMLLPMEKAE
jgi:hypothetical protein